MKTKTAYNIKLNAEYVCVCVRFFFNPKIIRIFFGFQSFSSKHFKLNRERGKKRIRKRSYTHAFILFWPGTNFHHFFSHALLLFFLVYWNNFRCIFLLMVCVLFHRREPINYCTFAVLPCQCVYTFFWVNHWPQDQAEKRYNKNNNLK